MRYFEILQLHVDLTKDHCKILAIPSRSLGSLGSSFNLKPEKNLTCSKNRENSFQILRVLFSLQAGSFDLDVVARLQDETTYGYI